MSDKKWIKAEDVARLAGVSRSAVSRTFTPGASVSEKTRQKVLSAAEAPGLSGEYHRPDDDHRQQ